MLSDGEIVSIDGTHLGHNLPDITGNRFCINLVSIAGDNINYDEENIVKKTVNNNKLVLFKKDNCS